MINIRRLKLSSVAVILGIAALILSMLIVFIAFKKSLSDAEKSLYKFYRSKALFINAFIENRSGVADTVLLEEVDKIYRNIEKQAEDEYVCIVDNESDLILHTLSPHTVGENAGKNLVLGQNKKCTLMDLVNDRENFTGRYISSSGDNQIAAFVHVPSRQWTIGVHRSKKQLQKEIATQYQWFIVTFFIIIGGFIPVSLIILYRAARVSERSKIAVEIKAKIQLENKNLELTKAKDAAENTEELLRVKNEELLKANKELIRAKKKAEESDELKTAFLENMSHEIRTPMNGIIGFAKLLGRSLNDPVRLKQYAKIIIDSSNELLNMVNDILDISKIETGQVETVENEISLNKVLIDIYNFFQGNFEQRRNKLELECALKTGNDNILLDNFKLRHIILNLLNNASKFTENGKITMGYSLTEDKLRFYVKDTGKGIDEKFHHLIFERFQQARTEDTEFSVGVGLGLAISKGYVELMGGKIWVESEKGKGSKFYFEIPYKPTKFVELKIPKRNRMLKLKGATILVVEDDETNFLLIKEILENSDAKIIHEVNGLEAVKICKSNKEIDVVLMDIKLPGMNGYEATKEIKAINKDLPIIAQTAYAFSEDREKALRAGCDDYIAKPIIEEHFIILLEKYLKK